MPILSHKFKVYLSTNTDTMLQRTLQFFGIGQPRREYAISAFVSSAMLDRAENRLYLKIMKDDEMAGLAEYLLKRKVTITIEQLNVADEVIETNTYLCRMIGYDTYMDYGAGQYATYNLIFRIINGK